MPRAKLSLDDVEQIKEGDVLGRDGLAVQVRLPVLERDVIDEMIVDANVDGDHERERTAGVRVRDASHTRLLSYQLIGQRDYTVHRKWDDLTDEQEMIVRARA